MKKYVVKQKGKTITSVYTEYEMARNFLQSHIGLPMYKELKICEINSKGKE